MAMLGKLFSRRYKFANSLKEPSLNEFIYSIASQFLPSINHLSLLIPPDLVLDLLFFHFSKITKIQSLDMPGSQLAIFFVVLLFHSPFYQALYLNVSQCLPIAVNITDGTPPYALTITSTEKPNDSPLKTFSIEAAGVFLWQPDLSPGTRVDFQIRDSQGEMQTSPKDFALPKDKCTSIPNLATALEESQATAALPSAALNLSDLNTQLKNPTSPLPQGSINTNISTAAPSSKLPSYNPPSIAKVAPPDDKARPLKHNSANQLLIKSCKKVGELTLISILTISIM
ncbi:hypothetical protein O181_008327 [Austropuccinia psidii MF-1]|uniref:Uncharacterized protein n=1 Tax=Austropuccinia psidii MF-1 TaxID=1389203 RepID=A0A9Q3GJA8_9BASI|nr:hypothetical protein [Austropuccinia psidii MF-1]